MKEEKKKVQMRDKENQQETGEVKVWESRMDDEGAYRNKSRGRSSLVAGVPVNTQKLAAQKRRFIPPFLHFFIFLCYGVFNE